jgi:hypothetical protein
MTPTVEESIKRIQEVAKNFISNRQGLLLKLSLNAVGIDLDCFKSIVEKIRDPGTGTGFGSGTVDSYELAAEIARIVQSPLQIDKIYKSIEIPKYNDNIILALNSIAPTKLSSAATCLEFFEKDISETLKYRTYLLSKKRQLQKRNKWGEVDLQEWGKLLHEFAVDKTISGEIDNIINKAMPANVIKYFEANNCMYGFNVVSLGLSGDVTFLESCLGVKVAPEEKELSGIEYEFLIKETLEVSFPNFIIELTPVTGDHGADIIVSTPHKKIAIQAKRQSSSVGNSAVQEVFAAMQFYNAEAGIVVTNSTYTNAARVLASSTGVILSTTEDLVEIIKEIIN